MPVLMTNHYMLLQQQWIPVPSINGGMTRNGSRSISGIKSVYVEWQKYKPVSQDEVIPPAGFHLFRRRPKHDQLEAYINEPAADEAVDVLAYWRSRENQWPELARMARRYMAIPASSAPSERCFSSAKYIVPFQRNRLHPQMFKKSVLLQSWIKLLDQ